MADISSESHDITADLIEQTPIEKCSLNPRRGRNSRRLLTGFIIYASEVRKEVVEKYPDQNFGFISKLVGDKWRDLSKDLRFKYHQRALIHNKRIKELAAREGVSLGDIDLANGSVIKAPKVTKNKSKKSKEGKNRLNDSTCSVTQTLDSSSASSDTPNNKKTNGISNNSYSNGTGVGPLQQGLALANTTKSYNPENTNSNNNHHPTKQSSRARASTVDSATQTPPVRFIEPPPKSRLSFSDAFLNHLLVRQRLK